MNSYMAYEAVSVKIKSRLGHIADREKFDRLLDCKNVDEVTEYIRNNYSMKDIIDRAGSRELHRNDLETLLKRYLVEEIESILHYFSGPYKEFVRTFLMEYEINDLVTIIRKIAKGETVDNAADILILPAGYRSVPIDRLLAAKNVTQCLEYLKKTAYYYSLKTVTDEDVVEREFHIEMKLHLLFYKTLLNRAQKLASADRQAAMDIIGLKIDLLNVQWIYRAKKYFDISPEEMLIYSLQGGKKLGFNRLKQLCYLKTVDEIQKLSNKLLGFNIFTSGHPDGTDANDLDIERNIDGFLFEYARKSKFEGTIGPVILYIYMLDIIVRELVTATEGIRYSLPREELYRYLGPLKKHERR